MENYRPKQKSVVKKIFDSAVLQFGVLFLLAGGAAFFLYQRDQASLKARVSYLKGSVQINSTDNQASKAFVEKAFDEAPAAEAQSVAAALAATDAVGNAAAASTDKKPDDTKAATAAKTAGPVLRVFYAEVSRAALQRIFEESQNTGQFMTFKDDYSAGIIPNIDSKLSPSNTNIKILHKEERPLEMGKSLQWFYGLKDRQEPDTEIGLTTFIEMNEIGGGNYRGNMEIQRSWREIGDGSANDAGSDSPLGGPSVGGAGAGGPGGIGRVTTIQRRSFPAIFEIGSSTGFFISGVMPYKTNLDSEDDLTNMDVFKIIKSDEFQRKGSDFVIFVELDPK